MFGRGKHNRDNGDALMLILQAQGFMMLPDPIKAKILEVAIKTFNGCKGKVDFIVFKDMDEKPYFEDEGRALVFPIKGVPEKVYVTIDDFGETEKWNELYDAEIVQILKKSLGNQRYAITFMLAEGIDFEMVKNAR
jgi:hypothetical protein